MIAIYSDIYYICNKYLRLFDEDLRLRLQKENKTTAVVPTAFHSFDKLEENLLEQVQKVKSHPWTPKDIPVRGFIYDVKSGKLKEVTA